ncbi:MAG TPA: MmgE/PrpD family protein [Burkholderiales bacterium]|nr:MmgE/PrpD family protein [Burkholderiales bacterium]
MAGNVTQDLARFAAGLSYDQIPQRAREHCKNLLLDAVACALAGHRGEETHQVAAFAAGLAQSRESSVMGGDRLSLAGATLLNGYLITAVTMCDVHRATLTHITPEVMPPALAIAERDALSGRELLVALAAGSETMTRIGTAMDWPAARARGWHGPGVLGPFGAAAAVGRLLGFDEETMARAFGLAGSQSAGTFAAWGTPTVKFHQCRGALSGLMAALLAQQKFVATREFLTAPDGGLFSTYSNGGRPEALTEGLSRRWELENIALRLWPSASTIQGFVTAMFDLVEKHRVGFDQVRKLRVSLNKTAVDMHGIFPRYQGKFEALLSTHYCAAAILHDRALTLAQFEPGRYNDPVLARFAAERVEMKADPALSGVQCVVEAETVDGRTVSIRCDHPRGSPENPLTRAQIEEKFRTYAGALLPGPAVEEAVGAIARLEELKSVRRLMDLLRVGDVTRARRSA